MENQIPTPFSEVYEFFEEKIISFDLANLLDEELEYSEEIKLRIAVSRFKQGNIIMDRKNKVFNRALTDEEINILSLLMVCEWMKPNLYSEEAVRDNMGSTDYTNHSPANFLPKLISAKKESEREANILLNQYNANLIKESIRKKTNKNES